MGGQCASATVNREVDGGLETVKVKLPAGSSAQIAMSPYSPAICICGSGLPAGARWVSSAIGLIRNHAV